MITMFAYAFPPTSVCRSLVLIPSQLWKVEGIGEERKITYLSTLVKHTQAVNVVRFSPKGIHRISGVTLLERPADGNR